MLRVWLSGRVFSWNMQDAELIPSTGLEKKLYQAGKMPQQGKAQTAKPGDLSSIPESHVIKKTESDLPVCAIEHICHK